MFQLPLGIQLPEHIVFDNFIAGKNHAVVDMVRAFSQGQSPEQHLYLNGSKGTGKSHLLQAACQLAGQQSRACAYIPLGQAAQFDPSLLCDLHTLALVCLDDVQAIAGNKAWEQGLFALYQRAGETGVKLLWAASWTPAHMPIQLADLKSRLAATLVLELVAAGDEEKIAILQERAHSRGLELPSHVADYLIGHYSRHLEHLLAMLDILDKESLVAQRRLTIPFLKEVLEHSAHKAFQESTQL